MWVSGLQLQNVRGFIEANIHFSKNINVIVGHNNSGKSTILKSLLLLQYEQQLLGNDLRIGQESGLLRMTLNDNIGKYFPYLGKTRTPIEHTIVETKLPQINYRVGLPNRATQVNFKRISTNEPDNFIYPYLSKRKAVTFNEVINTSSTRTVADNLINLYAKIDRISNPQYPAYNEYIHACEEILGFQVTTTDSGKGKKAAYIVNNFDSIPLDSMGEGVVNSLGLIVDLCIAEDKLFLIEEPENDVHPKALKSLLRFLVEKSQNNQFIVTTHSNIVTKYLGAQKDGKVFSVEMVFSESDRLPISTIKEVEDPEERRKILEDLGYELTDLDLWNGWLILEESSAEKIIREFLIPWFTPKLRKTLRTFDTKGKDGLERKFNDFTNLFVFLHLQSSYKNKAWVVIDGGEEEQKIIDKLKRTYAPSGWKEDQFLQFTEHDFEKYYPEQFQEQVEAVLSITDKKEKRNAKKSLLEEVEDWIKTNKMAAKKAFERSASEVIGILKSIEQSLCF